MKQAGIILVLCILVLIGIKYTMYRALHPVDSNGYTLHLDEMTDEVRKQAESCRKHHRPKRSMGNIGVINNLTVPTGNGTI